MFGQWTSEREREKSVFCVQKCYRGILQNIADRRSYPPAPGGLRDAGPQTVWDTYRADCWYSCIYNVSPDSLKNVSTSKSLYDLWLVSYDLVFEIM